MPLPPHQNPFLQPSARLGKPLTPTSDKPEGRGSLVMRKFHISSLTRSGAIYTTDQVGPATPEFEAAFSGFAHGTLIKTTEGMVAVEDLVPGMQLITSQHGPMPLLWIGSMILATARDDRPVEQSHLTRIMTDSFGFGRPADDLMAGPGARILVPATDLPDLVGTDQVLSPARALVDGVNVISISPPRPVSTYHLCLQRHATIMVSGLEAETFHPGSGFAYDMTPTMLSLFLSFFPHIHTASDFGPLAYTRLRSNGVHETD